MRQFFRSRPALTEETHRATSFEIFFDLVFIFALTRVTAFLAASPSFLRLGQGLILLSLLWWSWSAYTWIGNQARADRGLIRAGTLVAMAAIFVAALVMPDAWRSDGGLDAPVVLALAYGVVRVIYLPLYVYAAAGEQRLRTQLLIGTVPQALAWTAIILGALYGDDVQTLLWAAALFIDMVGGRLSSAFSGWQLRSPSHFAERHGLVVIIAFGESLISIGVGAGPAVTEARVLIAALLGLIAAVCLWWLLFENVAPAGAEALSRASTAVRPKIARDAYTQLHLPLIAGIIYLAFGVEEVVAHASDESGPAGGAPLGWTVAVALYGGVVLYLVGRAVFLWVTGQAGRPVALVVAAAILGLLPAGRILPALAALGLVTALLVGLVGFEWLRRPAGAPAGG